MPNFSILRQATPKKTFRVASIMGMYDLETNKIQERFEGNIELPKEWKVGLIVGNSGTGKTTIAKELFSDSYITNFEYTHESILDDMPLNRSIQEIAKTLTHVGFSSPPSWLKPYQVLSNGEKMRCDLARAILSDENLFVFDEFTSVVDRNVAKVGSFAMQKAIRKVADKQMIAVTCHFDVEDWLLPDWVFNTNDMTFRICDSKKKRPNIRLDIVKYEGDKNKIWKRFAKYHYLSHYHNNAANVYLCLIDDVLGGFCSVLTFPHPFLKRCKREHRTVVLPDFQGIGIATAMTDAIAEMYKREGYSYISTTSNPALIYKRCKSHKWIATTKKGRKAPGNKNGYSISKPHNTSKNRLTMSFKYIGENGKNKR